MTFKIGDKVQIVKKVTKQANWNNNWDGDMSLYVGKFKVYTITRITSFGIALAEDEKKYYWPSNSLQLFTGKKLDLVAMKCKHLWNTSNWVKNNPEQAY